MRVKGKSKVQFDYDELAKDASAGADLMGRFADADWWTWCQGSSLLFWQ
jgi:hypothetical protein